MVGGEWWVVGGGSGEWGVVNGEILPTKKRLPGQDLELSPTSRLRLVRRAGWNPRGCFLPRGRRQQNGQGTRERQATYNVSRSSEW